MHLKMYTRRITLSLLFLAFAIPFFAQTENCTNGIDDDGDGLIDCYDQDCTCSGQCEDFYYTTCNADCYYVPPCNNLSLGIQWVGEAETGTYSPLVAGDMDKDGIPEIVTYWVENPDIYIIDGATGATKVHIVGPTVYAGGTAPAIADLDHDGYGELILVGNDRILRCWEHDGTLKFESTVPVGYNLRYRFAVPNIADFDHDGWAEINIGNQVFNGQTGALLAEGGSTVSAGEHPARVATGFSFCSTVAIDALPDSFCPDCDGLEIVAGNQVLSVNLVTGVVTPVVTADPAFSDGYTSVADFDGDGDLDAIVQGKKNGFNTVYCWEIETPTVIRQYKLLNNFGEGASRVNVADLNGDGKLEISFVSYPRLYALTNNFTLMWTRATNDNSSITCSSVFDFCGDGSSDVIYRGESKLQILEGSTGIIKWEDDCLSATHIENPLVLDVDADGQTEIVIECGTNGTKDVGSVIAYEAMGKPSIASRKVWNQHGYFNTNINDDLSVPRYQQNPNIVGDSLRLNTFMNQYFNPTFPTPDGALSLNNVLCVKDSLVLSFSICNPGDNVLPAVTPVSFYKGNPQKAGALWAGAIPLGFTLAKDSCRNFTMTIPRIANDSIFAVLNDDHSFPTPYSLSQNFPVTTIGECKFNNNMVSFYYAYNPAPVQLGVDTAICDNATLLLSAAGTDLVSWQWQDGSTNASFTAPDAGTYAVVATDICGNTQSDQVVITIDSSTVVQIGPDVEICRGESVTLNESGFDYYGWTPGSFINCAACPTVSATPTVSGYIILQAGFNNGCLSRDSMYITVHDTFNYAIDTTVCYGRTVEWNGQTIQPEENRTFAMQSIYGCDSTVTVRVHGTPIGTFNITVDTAVCVNHVLPYNGFDLLPGENKLFLLTAATGCDSTVLVKVAPKDTFATTEALVLCYGQQANIFGNIQQASGVFEHTFTAKNGCDSTHTVMLTVLDPISVAISSTPSCGDEATGTLSALAGGSAPPFSFAWNIPGANNFYVQNVAEGNYDVTVTDANDCTQEASGLVTEYPPVQFSLTVDSVRCYGESSGVIHLQSPDPTLTFSLGGQGFIQASDFKNLKSDQYIVYGQDVYGCVDTVNVYVPEPPELFVYLPQDTLVNLGDSIPFEIYSTAVSQLTYNWADSSYLNCVNCPTPVARPLATIRYRLLVRDVNGCAASDDWFIQVQRVIGVFAPNAVAPGSASDINSRWEPNLGQAVQKVNLLQIFDRWGNLLHEARNAFPGDASLVWDGRQRGDYVTPGVYVWRMEVELVDGSLEKLGGDLTVIR